jgi:hypothetical protein
MLLLSSCYIQKYFTEFCPQSMYQIWDVRVVEKNSSPWRESKCCHPSHIQSHYWLSFRLKITYTCLNMLKIAVCTPTVTLSYSALCRIFRSSLICFPTKKKSGFHCTEHIKLLLWFLRGIHAVGVHNFQRDETVLSGKCLTAFFLPTDAQESCFNRI